MGGLGIGIEELIRRLPEGMATVPALLEHVARRMANAVLGVATFGVRSKYQCLARLQSRDVVQHKADFLAHQAIVLGGDLDRRGITRGRLYGANPHRHALAGTSTVVAVPIASPVLFPENVAAQFEFRPIGSSYCAEGYVILRRAIGKELGVPLEGRHVRTVPRSDSSPNIGLGAIVLVDAVWYSHLIGLSRHRIHKGPDLAQPARPDQVYPDITIRIDVGPSGIGIPRFRVLALDVDLGSTLVEYLAIGSSRLAGVPSIIVLFANVSIVVIDSVLVAKAEHLTIPDSHRVLRGRQVHVVRIPQDYRGQDVRINAILPPGFPFVGRVEKELGSAHDRVNAHFVLRLDPRSNRASGLPQVVIIAQLVPEGASRVNADHARGVSDPTRHNHAAIVRGTTKPPAIGQALHGLAVIVVDGSPETSVAWMVKGELNVAVAQAQGLHPNVPVVVLPVLEIDTVVIRRRLPQRHSSGMLGRCSHWIEGQPAHPAPHVDLVSLQLRETLLRDVSSPHGWRASAIHRTEYLFVLARQDQFALHVLSIRLQARRQVPAQAAPPHVCENPMAMGGYLVKKLLEIVLVNDSCGVGDGSLVQQLRARSRRHLRFKGLQPRDDGQPETRRVQRILLTGHVYLCLKSLVPNPIGISSRGFGFRTTSITACSRGNCLIIGLHLHLAQSDRGIRVPGSFRASHQDRLPAAFHTGRKGLGGIGIPFRDQPCGRLIPVVCIPNARPVPSTVASVAARAGFLVLEKQGCGSRYPLVRARVPLQLPHRHAQAETRMGTAKHALLSHLGMAKLESD